MVRLKSSKYNGTHEFIRATPSAGWNIVMPPYCYAPICLTAYVFVLNFFLLEKCPKSTKISFQHGEKPTVIQNVCIYSTEYLASLLYSTRHNSLCELQKLHKPCVKHITARIPCWTIFNLVSRTSFYFTMIAVPSVTCVKKIQYKKKQKTKTFNAPLS